MKAKIGPDSNKTGHIYLENEGRVYGNYKMVNDVRMRSLEGVPARIVMQFSLPFAEVDDDLHNYKTFLEGHKSEVKNVDFCVIQESSTKVPVFMLPATQDLTVNMNDKERAAFMKEVFDHCYAEYSKSCTYPVDQKYCAATVVAGTKTMWGGKHFTTMIKPPGDEQWLHVDPTDFGGPQKFNRKQCGGYSSMIEAEALMHYSSKTIVEAREDEKQNRVIRSLLQFIDTLAFKFNTWFAGARNDVIRNAGDEEVPRMTFETSYAEMADFSAGRLARAFNNQKFIETRIYGKSPTKDSTEKSSEQDDNTEKELGSDWTIT
ncbi:hypothetical protein [Legionella parisiensis]|nr:hypothetical protein [Legionella parisiensis]